MVDPERLCMRCMSELTAPGAVCSVCGFDNSAPENELHQLPCGSILAGAYFVGRALGQGGFGITYIGWDLNLNSKIAIKEYYPEGCVRRDQATQSTVVPLSGDKGEFFINGRTKFVDEGRTLARFAGDPAIVNVRAFFNENGTAYLVMDYVEGETLKSYAARRGGKLPADETLRLMLPIIDSLSRVHAAGLLHRDIAPDNIMLCPDGTVKLLDFGAARQISAQGERSLTINVKHGFAPEEQYRTRGEQGPWTDVYAICATIYRLTTGVNPPPSMDRLVEGDTLAPPNRYGAGFTPAAEAALLHGLAVRKKDRCQSMEQLKNELYPDIAAKKAEAERLRREEAEKQRLAEEARKRAEEKAEAEKKRAEEKTEAAKRKAEAAERKRTEAAKRKAAAEEARRARTERKRAATDEIFVADEEIEEKPGETPEGKAAEAALAKAPRPRKKAALIAVAAVVVCLGAGLAVWLSRSESAANMAVDAATPAPITAAPTPRPTPTVTPSPSPTPEPTPFELVSGDYELLVTDGKAVITGYNGAEQQLKIPAEIDGYTVTEIGYAAFYECKSLTSVTIPESVATIGERAFSMCDALTSVTIPEGVTTIGEYAFYFCDALTSVTIPEGVTTIGECAFSVCNALTSVTIPASVTSIGAGAFNGCDFLSGIQLSPDNPAYVCENGILYNKDKTLLHTCLLMAAQGRFTIPKGVTEIGDFAFGWRFDLTSVTIPEGVERIGEEAFWNCGALTSVTIPASVTDIGRAAFGICYRLNAIQLSPDNPAYVCENGILYNKDKTLLHTCLLMAAQGRFTIPEGVTEIGDFAFYMCDALTSVTIPASVTDIGRAAFGGCDNLTIHAPADSYAAQYAAEKGIPFELLP